METVAWLFDLYPLGDRIVLWFLTPEGEALRLEDAFPYLVYVGGNQGQVRRAVQTLKAERWLQHAYPTRGRDLGSGEEIPVWALEPKTYAHLPQLRAWLGKREGVLAAYNCDLDVPSYYLYRRGIWPGAWYDLEAGTENSRPSPPGKSSSPGISPYRPWLSWVLVSPGTPSFPWAPATIWP